MSISFHVLSLKLATAVRRQSKKLCTVSLDTINKLRNCKATIESCLTCHNKNGCQHCRTTILIIKFEGSIFCSPHITNPEFDELLLIERHRIRNLFDELPPSAFKIFINAQIEEARGNWDLARKAYLECCFLGIDCFVPYGLVCQKLADNPQCDVSPVFEAQIAFLFAVTIYGNESAKRHLLGTLLQNQGRYITLGELVLYDIDEAKKVFDEWLKENQALAVLHLMALIEAQTKCVLEHLHDAYPQFVLAAPSHVQYVCDEHDWCDYPEDNPVSNHMVPGTYFKRYCTKCGEDN